MFKKVYLEVINNCNLNCKFCPKNKRDKKYISIEEFKIVINKLKGYTDYLYFHIMGEPLLHESVNELIDIGSRDFNINITTNGYLIKRIKNNKNIRQINISLHSFNPKYGKKLDNYLNDIFEVADYLSIGTYINYRIWTSFVDKDRIIHKLEEKYKVKIEDDHVKLANNVYLDFDIEFDWPSFNNSYYSEVGTCLGTRSHIGILVDGTVVPCCLDNEGIINLGNIYKQEINDIINSEKFISIKKRFLFNKKVCELCKKCNFYTKTNH